MKIAAPVLFLLYFLQSGFAAGQTAPVPDAPQKEHRSSATTRQRSTAQDREPPCPKGRKQTAEAIYGDYVIRTYRWPEPEGCLQILKSKKLVYSLESADFRIGNNFADDAGIPIGTNITGVGKPNAIVGEWSGGAHCCFTFHIFELGETFKEIARIKAEHSDGAKFVDLSHDGSYEFEGNDWAFAYWRTSFAESPAPRIVLKYRAGRFRLAYELMKKPAPSAEEFASTVQSIRSDEGWGDVTHPDCKMNCDVPVSLWSNMLDLMYTGHADLSWKLFDQSWPPTRMDKTVFAKEFCEVLSASHYWSDLRTETGQCPPSKRP